jgi:FO synthase
MRRRVTFSRNLTLSLSRTCRCYCKYCAFATHQAHLYPPDEVLEILDGAAKRQVKELLVLTGERPEVNPEVAARPRGLHGVCRVDVRARARAGPAAAHEPRRALT